MPFIETTDRTQLFYVDGGAGKAVDFMARAWLSSRVWEFQFPYLVARTALHRADEGTAVQTGRATAMTANACR